MKISSYDSQGKFKEVANYALLVPDYIMSFDKNKSVFPLYRQYLNEYPRDEVFRLMMAETLFGVDYGNFLKSPFSQLKRIEMRTGETSLSTPEYEDYEYELNKLVGILNYYGHKSRRQIVNDSFRGKKKNIDCLSTNTWILSLANFAQMKANRREHRSEPYEFVFRMEFQSVINRYYLALRIMLYTMHSTEVEEQIRVLKPFVSRNLFRIEPRDVAYDSDDFLLRIVDYFSLNNNCRRQDSYCILQLLRGDYQPVNGANDTPKLLCLKISGTKYDATPVIYNIRRNDGGFYEVELSDKELAYLRDPNPFDKGVAKLMQLINEIKVEYERNKGEIWDNYIFARKLCSDSVHPEKIQSWSYLYFDELSRLNKISTQESWKAQTCYYCLIYNSVNTQSPQEIMIDGKKGVAEKILYEALFEFFPLIRKNNSESQEGFYEKLYIMNKIITNADLDDIKLMTKIESWNQIEWNKKNAEAIDDLINFLNPILNSSYVNETVISIDILKRMIKNILKGENFLKQITQKRPAQLIKKIESKNGCTYNCNIALLFNILGVFYRYHIPFLKGSPYLLRQSATNAFNELVLPYGITGDKNNNKFLTRYDQHGSFSLISTKMEEAIVSEIRNRKYYKS